MSIDLNAAKVNPFTKAELAHPQGMLRVGDRFPNYSVKGIVTSNPEDAIIDVNEKTYAGKWLIMFAWPKDFTFVCPTEIAAFSKMNSEFQDRDAQILGFSVDNEYVHLAWRQHHKDLQAIQFPMLSDLKREISYQCGILHPTEGVAQRATFIIDPDHIVRFAMMTDLNIGRNPKEVLRILDALQTGGRCPCEWQPGDDTI